MGKLDQASEYFQIAEREASQSIFPKYQLWNNQATLDMVRNEISPLTRNKLENALRVCSNSGDKMIITSNLLALAIAEKEIRLGARLYNDLLVVLQKTFKPTSTIGIVCLFNCHRFAVMMGDADQANKIHQEYLSQCIINRFSSLWNFLIHETGENPFPWMTDGTYFPHFIYDWDVDYYTALNNFQ